MATVSFNLPDEKIDAIVDAFCAQEGYQDMIWDANSQVPVLIPNPETKMQFTKKALRKLMKDAYVRHQALLASEAAKVVAEGEV